MVLDGTFISILSNTIEYLPITASEWKVNGPLNMPSIIFSLNNIYQYISRISRKWIISQYNTYHVTLTFDT